MKKSVAQGVIIIALSFASGLVANMINEGGIALPHFFMGEHAQQVRAISPDSAFFLHLGQNVTFIDTRPEEDFVVDRLPQAISKTLQGFLQAPAKVDPPPGTHLIFYCFEAECREAEQLASAYSALYGDSVFVLNGGMAAWLALNFPIETQPLKNHHEK